MNGIIADLRLAVRSLFKTRMVTILAVITLALGIGATSAIFSVLDATLLKPPPYPEAEELVAVWGVMPNRDIDTWQASPDMVERYEREAEQFKGFAAAFGNQHIFKTGPDSQPEQIAAVGMTWNLFEVLDVGPMIGRSFEPLDAAFIPEEVPPGVPSVWYHEPKSRKRGGYLLVTVRRQLYSPLFEGRRSEARRKYQ